MLQKEPTGLCVCTPSKNDMKAVTGFSRRLTAEYRKDLMSILIKYALTLLIVIAIFSFLTGNLTLGLLRLILPFLIIVTAGYLIIIISQQLHAIITAVSIDNFIRKSPEMILVSPDDYIFDREYDEYTSNDVGSPAVTAVCFRSKTDNTPLSYGKHHPGMEYDALRPGKHYRFFLLGQKYLLCVMVPTQQNLD